MTGLQEQFNQQQDVSVNAHGVKSREMAEVQSQIFLAKQYPRNEVQAEMKITESCKRLSLAETAIYEFPRGGTKVNGPSIRLAETLARHWGNISYGINELEQKNGESTVKAFAWDMESNTRVEKVFQVRHERVARGTRTKLTDPRDIYELTANNGSRRLRACILGVLPGDIVDKAVDQCKKTLESGYEEPLKDRIVKALGWFKDNYGITQPMVEDHFGYSVDSFTAQDYLKMRTISSSLKDGMAKREDFFNNSKQSADNKPKTSLENEFKEGDQSGTDN